MTRLLTIFVLLSALLAPASAKKDDKNDKDTGSDFSGSSTTFTKGYDPDDHLCCLCNDCELPVSGRGSMAVTTKGETCNDISLLMSDPLYYSPGSGKCNTMRAQYYNTCCNPNYTPIPVQVEQKPDRPVYAQGPEPLCNLCPSGKFPLRPFTVTAVLYMNGNPTCEQLYYLGIHGHILERLCNPLQDYFEEPCGCPP